MIWSLYLYMSSFNLYLLVQRVDGGAGGRENMCKMCHQSLLRRMALYGQFKFHCVVRRAWGEWLLTFLHKRVVKIDVNVTCNCGQNICKCLTFLLCAYKQQKRDCVKHISLLWALLDEIFWPCVNICMACNSLLWHTHSPLGKKEKLRATTFNGIFCWHYVAAHR